MQQNVASNDGFTCEFDTAAVTHAPAVPKIIYRTAVLTVLTVIGVSVSLLTGVAVIVAVTGSLLIPEVTAVSKVPAVATCPL